MSSKGRHQQATVEFEVRDGTVISCPVDVAKANSIHLHNFLDGNDEKTTTTPYSLKDRGLDAATMKRMVEHWKHHHEHPQERTEWEKAYPKVQKTPLSQLSQQAPVEDYLRSLAMPQKVPSTDYLSSLAMPQWDQTFFRAISNEDEGHQGHLKLLEAAHYFNSPTTLTMSAAFIATYVRHCVAQGKELTLLLVGARSTGGANGNSHKTKKKHAHQPQQVQQQAQHLQQMPQAFYEHQSQHYDAPSNPTPSGASFKDPFEDLFERNQHATAIIADMVLPNMQAVLGFEAVYPTLFNASIHVARFWEPSADQANKGAIVWNQPHSSFAKLSLRRFEVLSKTLKLSIDNINQAQGDCLKLRDAISKCESLDLSVGEDHAAVKTVQQLLLDNFQLRELSLTGSYLVNAEVLRMLHMMPLTKLCLDARHPQQHPRNDRYGRRIAQQQPPTLNWNTLPLPNVATLVVSSVNEALPTPPQHCHVTIVDSTFSSPKVLKKFLAKHQTIELQLERCSFTTPDPAIMSNELTELIRKQAVSVVIQGTKLEGKLVEGTTTIVDPAIPMSCDDDDDAHYSMGLF